jgi:hypothetical protein
MYNGSTFLPVVTKVVVHKQCFRWLNCSVLIVCVGMGFIKHKGPDNANLWVRKVAWKKTHFKPQFQLFLLHKTVTLKSIRKQLHATLVTISRGHPDNLYINLSFVFTTVCSFSISSQTSVAGLDPINICFLIFFPSKRRAKRSKPRAGCSKKDLSFYPH